MPGRSLFSLLPAPWLVLVLTFPAAALAETYVSGPVSGTWDPAGSPYIVTGALEVPAGETLLVEPGVEVRFDGPYPLRVSGRLQAAGTEVDSIRFVPLIEDSPWQGIRFLESDPGSVLSYCRLSGSEVSGWEVADGCGGAIYSQNSSPRIEHCTISDCRATLEDFLEGYGGGAVFCLGGSPEIVSNRILECIDEAQCLGGGGAICLYGSDALVEDNLIRGCRAHGQGGGLAATGSSLEIIHNRFIHCSGYHYGGAIAIRDGCSGRIFDNLILENEVPDYEGGGIFVDGHNIGLDLEIAFCTILGNHVDGGSIATGGGIFVGDYALPDIHDCIVWGNTATVGEQVWPEVVLGLDHCDVEGGYYGDTNFDLDPLFVTGPPGDGNGCYLSAVATGHGVDSPCIDVGRGSAESFHLDERTTRIDLVPDVGIVDIGFHYGIPVPTGIESADFGSGESGWTAGTARACPNPFRDRTTIVWRGAVGGPLSIFDLSGRVVRTFEGGTSGSAGDSPSILWDGRDDAGRRVAPGVYFLRAQGSGGGDPRIDAGLRPADSQRGATRTLKVIVCR